MQTVGVHMLATALRWDRVNSPGCVSGNREGSVWSPVPCGGSSGEKQACAALWCQRFLQALHSCSTARLQHLKWVYLIITKRLPHFSSTCTLHIENLLHESLLVRKMKLIASPDVLRLCSVAFACFCFPYCVCICERIAQVVGTCTKRLIMYSNDLGRLSSEQQGQMELGY